MKMAVEADACLPGAKSALFPPATDAQAQAISDATENARAEVAIAGGQSTATSNTRSKKRIRLDRTYNLPLYMTGDQKDATDALRKSEGWLGVETEILAVLTRCCITYGITGDEADREVDGGPHERGSLESVPAVSAFDVYPEAEADAAQTGEALEEKADDEEPLAYA